MTKSWWQLHLKRCEKRAKVIARRKGKYNSTIWVNWK